MLILSRRVNERIIIDGPCVLTLVRVGPHTAKIGFEASKSVNIRREEVPDNRPVATGDEWEQQ